jgi:hypothetical protein
MHVCIDQARDNSAAAEIADLNAQRGIDLGKPLADPDDMTAGDEQVLLAQRLRREQLQIGEERETEVRCGHRWNGI